MASFDHFLVDRNVIHMIEDGSLTSNQTALLIAKLAFDRSTTIRTSTVVLTTFNLIAAFLTFFGILYESWKQQRRLRGPKKW
jgi:hypothetical protein